MNLLLTFCNTSYLPKQNFLGVYNWLEHKLQYVSLATNSPEKEIFSKGVGATGITKVEDGYIVTTQSSTHPCLIFLDLNLNLINWKALEIAKDPHSITYNQGFIYIASTGNNSIIKLPFNGNFGTEEIHWSFDDSSKDIIHLNGISFFKDELVVCCFGEKKDDKTIRSGFVKNISNNEILLEGIREPHNLTCYQDKLYVLESMTGSIYQIDQGTYKIYQEFTGYVRGLAFGEQNDIFVIRNARRRSSRHIGSKKNLPLIDTTNHICEWERAWICQSKSNQKTYEKRDMTAFAFEVYDLLVLDDNFNFSNHNLINFEEGISQRIINYENLCANLKSKSNQGQ